MAAVLDGLAALKESNIILPLFLLNGGDRLTAETAA